jgi:hypothetical protein
MIPDSLKSISVSHNPYNEMPILLNHENIDVIYPSISSACRIREYVNGFYKFANLFYSIKYKKQFRKWLWEKVREPKIMREFSPIKLNKIIEKNPDLELDDILFDFFENKG